LVNSSLLKKITMEMATANEQTPLIIQDNNLADVSDEPWEKEHINMGDGGFRAAVFGFNDGLVTNLCLVTGLVMASDQAPVLETGVAGLLAGAVSMGIGEWLSMTAQTEGLIHELNVERKHLQIYPKEEEHHMREILTEHGLSEFVIDQVMNDLASKPVEAKLNLHARLELGIDPEDLGSPWKAAISSFICFSVGAFIPLIPWLICEGQLAFWLTIILAAIASVIVGALFAQYSPRTALFNSSRQLIICAIATAFCIFTNLLFSQEVYS